LFSKWKHITLSINNCHKEIFARFWDLELAMRLKIIDWNDRGFMLNFGIQQPNYHQGKRLSNKVRNKKKYENTWE
jgi:hypothetical protein